jgi:hypothetical protein
MISHHIFGKHACDADGMREVGLAALAQLAGVGVLREMIGFGN